MKKSGIAHGNIKMQTIRPWISFDALLEESINIYIWADWHFFQGLE